MQLDKGGDWSSSSTNKMQQSTESAEVISHPVEDPNDPVIVQSDIVEESQSAFRDSIDISIRHAYDQVPVFQLPDLDPLEMPPDFEFKL
jgi:hypothetical protein